MFSPLQQKLSTIVAGALLCIPYAAQPLPAAADYGDPSVAAQLHLEAINRARANPQAEAQRLGLSSPSEGGVNISNTPQPPLAMNALLTQSAQGHSDDMAQQNYFNHTAQDGRTPFDRMQAAGYRFASAAENIAATSYGSDITERSLLMYKDLFIDANVSNRGHRVNILSSTYTEIGIGLANGKFLSYNGTYLTTDFARPINAQPQVLGVVYADKNGDGAYSAGEALSGVTVTAQETSASTQTASAGGYSLPLSNGDYSLVFSHPTLGRTERRISIAGQNLKVDILHSDFTATSPTPVTQNATLEPNGTSFTLSLPFVAVINSSGGTDYWQAQLRWDGSAFVLDGNPQQRSDQPATPTHAAQLFTTGGQTLVFLPQVKFGTQILSALLSFSQNRFIVSQAQSL